MNRFLILAFILLPFLSFSATTDSLTYVCYFGFNQTNYPSDSTIQLKKWMQKATKEHEVVGVHVYAYADTVGPADINLEISTARLKSITTILDKYSVNILHQQAYGESKSDQPLKNSISWRKVEITLVINVKESINYSQTIQAELIKQPSKKQQVFDQKVAETLRSMSQNESNKLTLNILFNGDKDTYLETNNADINALYLYLIEHPTYTIEIQGHVCCANEYRLSKARAHTVFKDLAKKGIAADRMTYEGYGNTKPLVKERDELSKQKNRRVDIIIYKNN